MKSNNRSNNLLTLCDRSDMDSNSFSSLSRVFSASVSFSWESESAFSSRKISY